MQGQEYVSDDDDGKDKEVPVRKESLDDGSDSGSSGSGTETEDESSSEDDDASLTKKDGGSRKDDGSDDDAPNGQNGDGAEDEDATGDDEGRANDSDPRGGTEDDDDGHRDRGGDMEVDEPPSATNAESACRAWSPSPSPNLIERSAYCAMQMSEDSAEDSGYDQGDIEKVCCAQMRKRSPILFVDFKQR